MKKLDGKTALITGGTTGIGLATAALFAKEGARVIITGQNEARVAKAAGEIGAAGFVSQAGDVGAIRSLFGRAKQEFGALDVIFFNAGIAKFAPIAAMDEAMFDETFSVNLKGVVFGVQSALPILNKGASIIVNASVNARIGMENTAAYAGSKAAVRNFVRVAANELAPLGVRINAISPGPIETPLYGKLGADEDTLKAIAAGLTQKIPLGRFGKPDEIARIALFLATGEASFITGADIVADGGMTDVSR